jgi:hypothetical protein
MHPKAWFRYYRYNRGRLALLVLPLFLAVFVLYGVHMILASYSAVQYNAFVETRRFYSSIQARGNLIDDATRQAVSACVETEAVIPCVLGYTEIEGILSSVGVRVYLLGHEDLENLVTRMGLILRQGRFPEPGSREIILHEDVLKNKHLNVGDWIGNDLAPSETLIGRHQIVGTLQGKALAGFASLETWMADTGVDTPWEYGLLVYPKPGRLAELNRYMSYLPLAGNDLSNMDNSMANMSKSVESAFLLLDVIYLALMLIVAVSLGFLTFLFQLGRRREFAILHVLGYSRTSILIGNVIGIAVINTVTTIAGILLATFVIAGLNAAWFIPSGTPLLLHDWETLLLSLCVPLACMAAQTLATGLSFSKSDPIAAIEWEGGGMA